VFVISPVSGQSGFGTPSPGEEAFEMQLILLLLLIIGVVVVMAAGFAGISYAFGMHLYRRNGTLAFATERDPCAQCNADRDWYLALPYWQQTVITAWWWANRFQWASKGCR
jgi:hypothetical protein